MLAHALTLIRVIDSNSRPLGWDWPLLPALTHTHTRTHTHVVMYGTAAPVHQCVFTSTHLERRQTEKQLLFSFSSKWKMTWITVDI